ncbi:hypothetical protein, partial [Lacticaseibacillus paracasei]
GHHTQGRLQSGLSRAGSRSVLNAFASPEALMLRFLTGPAHALDTHACDAYNDIKSKKAGMIDGRIAS